LKNDGQKETKSFWEGFQVRKLSQENDICEEQWVQDVKTLYENIAAREKPH
jgi:hypothetical protein